MIRARQEGIGEEELIAKMRHAHVADFTGFDIEFDNYGSTNSPENARTAADLGRAAQGRPGHPEGSDAALRSDRPARFWPTASSRGPAPSASRPASMAIAATSAGAL